LHKLSITAFNALSKTLEEPPDHAKFIFATTEPHKIPVTILSRCQRFDFRKIVLPKVTVRLREIADAEGIRISDRALGLVARRGEGSMRDSLSTLDQVIAFCGVEVADDDVQGLLGMVDRRLLLDVLEALNERDSRRVLDAVRRVDDLGHSFRQFCQELVDLCRALILCQVLEDPSDILSLSEDEISLLQRLGKEIAAEDAQRAMTLLMKTEGELVASSFPRLTMEMALLRLTTLPPSRDLAGLVRKLDELERRLASAGGLPAVVSTTPRSPVSGVREAEAPPKKPEAPAAPVADGGGWPGLVAQVRSRRPMIGSLLEHGSLLRQELPLLEIGFPAGSFHLDQLRDTETLAVLTDIAGEYYGQPVAIRVLSIEAGTHQAPPSLLEERQAQETDRRKRLREDALAHPMVQAAVKVFSGEVRDVLPIDKGYV
jgi:DNA polymerase-3 subunit gamma/tau